MRFFAELLCLHHIQATAVMRKAPPTPPTTPPTTGPVFAFEWVSEVVVGVVVTVVDVEVGRVLVMEVDDVLTAMVCVSSNFTSGRG